MNLFKFKNRIEEIVFLCLLIGLFPDAILLAVYGNWSFLKNQSKKKEEYQDYKLSWVAHIGVKRESRRLLGDVILKEQDLLSRVDYPDASFTTTWTIDLHYPIALEGFNEEPFLSEAKHVKIDPYAVLYRCLYSRNIENLFMAGRNISLKHVALGTVRVMRTTGMMGEVVGMAASIAKYHLFYSRWPRKLGMNAWVTHSEIAHSVSDSPFGPFEFKSIALPARGEKYWDGLVTHNPTIHFFDGKYYLYYMGNTGDGQASKDGLNWTHRNNQRIGVAIAEDPNGPWERFSKPLLDVSPDSLAHDALMVSNPSVTKMTDGKYLMVYKAVAKKGKMPFGGPVVHLTAIAEKPEGPFTKQLKPVFTAQDFDFPAEDTFVWYENKCYYAIVKDMNGAFTDAGRSLALFCSEGGTTWKLAEHPLVSDLQINWKNGLKQKVMALERPQLFFEDGNIVALLCAVNVTMDHSFNVQIPIIE